MSPGTWFYVPWPAIIRENRQNSLGVKFAHKLSCLEGFGSLLGLVMVPDLARNDEIQLPNDNAGFVHVFRKKHSTCPYTYTVAKALYDVARGLNCKVKRSPGVLIGQYFKVLMQVSVTKTKRCSGAGESAADAISKGDWDMAKHYVPKKNTDPEFIPRVLLRWISNPVPDLELGSKVLSEMSSYTKVLYLD